MAARGKIKDLVVVVPGILGSRLQVGGAPMWGDGSPTFLTWVRRHGADLGRLSVGSDDPSLDELGDGVTADGWVDGPLVIGRFVTVGGTSALLGFLAHEFRLKLGENLQCFSYDWRRDLRVAARRLATKVEGWLHTWRARSGNRSARVVLIGHAMGGLVARSYAELENGWSEISHLVTIGTPFLGSIRALDLLYSGVDFHAYGLHLQDLTPVARTLTSVYQLLPHYPSVRTFSGQVVSPFDIRIPTFEQQKLERARQLHRDLVERHARNRQEAAYAALRSLAIVGIGQPTVEQGQLLVNGTLSIGARSADSSLDGDGVVPRFSAEAPAPTGFDGAWVYLPQSHGMLAADPVVHAHLRDALRERRPGDPPPDTPLPRFTLHRTGGEILRIDADSLFLTIAQPFFRPGQWVEFAAGARSAGGYPLDARAARLEVRVDQASHLGRRVRPIRVRLAADRNRPGWLVGRMRAPAPGGYRATLSSRHRLLAPFRVSQFFEVDAGK